MIGLLIFAVGAIAGALKGRFAPIGACAVAALFWFLLFGPLDGELPGGLLFLVALVLLGVPVMTIFAEADEGSRWTRANGDGKAAFVLRGLGIFVMLGLTLSIAVGYAIEGTIGGAIVMAFWCLVLAWTFVPEVFSARPRS
ncbi:hypothetical protein BH24ACT23_BH24ACT23_00690 [soil metagenome]